MVARRLPLPRIHPAAHFGDGGDLRHPARHALRADRLVHADSGDLRPEHILHQHQPDGKVLRERQDALRRPLLPRPTSPCPVADVIEGRERYRPIQRAGVEMSPAEAPGHRLGRGRLPGGGGPVNRDDAHSTRCAGGRRRTRGN